jgi:hypothetical protein
MRTWRRIRLTVAVGLLASYVPGCTTWKLGYLSPADMSQDEVQVTTTDGRQLTLLKPWVRNDSLVAPRRNALGTADRDTIGVSLADVETLRLGTYTGAVQPGRTISAALAGTHPKRVRVTTATSAFELRQPWVEGDTLLGRRARSGSGAQDTIRVPLAGIQRLEMHATDPGATMVLVGVSLVVATGALLAVKCAYGCNGSFGF